MDSPTPDLDHLEEKLSRLKREYDLFLAGNRRIEPTSFRDELEREILKCTKYPFHSTAARFRMKNLAHRFRAMESQIRHLLDRKRGNKPSEGGQKTERPSVLVDRAALEHPAAIESHVRAIHRALADSLLGRPPPPLQALEHKILEEARRILERPGIYGIRFVLAEDESGLKILGEVVPQPKGND